MSLITPGLLPSINSMTKYPSIPTYHALDKKTGMLTEGVTAFFGPVFATEKVDGTNGRIVVFPDGDWLIGSREEWFTARDDRIPNSQLRIAEALTPVAQQLAEGHEGQPTITYYLEVYGHGVGGAAKQYAQLPYQLSCRLFDIAVFDEAETILGWSRERIASWRDGGGQPFVWESELRERAHVMGLQLVPRLLELDPAQLPQGVEEMRAWLHAQLPVTRVALAGDAGHRPEGVVLRDRRRLTIAKARFQDYDRTAKRRRSPAGDGAT